MDDKQRQKMVRTRTGRWQLACFDANEARQKAESALSAFQVALEDLKAVQEEYSEWKENLPESLASSPVGEKLETVCGIDFDVEAFEDMCSALDEADGVDLPLGFGKD